VAGTPFTEPEYVVPEAAHADELSVLFLAGIATKFRNPKIQAGLIALALVAYASGFVRTLIMRQLL